MNPEDTVPDPHERELFVRALEQPAGRIRADFLAGACGRDRALRQRIEVLLQKYDTLGSFLGSACMLPAKCSTAIRRGSTDSGHGV